MKPYYPRLDRKFNKVEVGICLANLRGQTTKEKIIYVLYKFGFRKRQRISQRPEPGQIDVDCPGIVGVGQTK